MGANFALLILLFAVSAFAADGDACFKIFAADGTVAIDSSKSVPANESKSARLHEEKLDMTSEDTMLEILQMYGALRNHENGYSEKKKNFMLARKLAGGYTVEMTYEKDTSDGVVVYNYQHLELVSPGGYRETLSKRPVNDRNWTFAQEYYYFNGPTGQFTVKIPMRIEGEVIKEMVTWGERLEFLDPADLQKLTSMSDLRGLYFKYFKKSQRALHITGTIKGYSKILFNVGMYALIAYFTLKKNSGDDEGDYDHSSLFMLLMNFKGGIRHDGLDATLKVVDEMENKGPPLASKEFIDPEPLAGKSRVITVSEYDGIMTVVEMTYERGRPVDGNVIVIPHEEGVFKVLSRALRAK